MNDTFICSAQLSSVRTATDVSNVSDVSDVRQIIRHLFCVNQTSSLSTQASLWFFTGFGLPEGLFTAPGMRDSFLAVDVLCISAFVTGPGWFPTIIGYCMYCMLQLICHHEPQAICDPIPAIPAGMQNPSRYANIVAGRGSRVAGRVTGSGAVAWMSHG